MKLTPEKLAQLKAIKAYQRAGEIHATVEITDEAFRALIADLEEANARADAAGNMSRYNATCRESLREELADVRKQLAEATVIRGNGVLVPSQKLEEMQAEIRTLRQQLSDTQNALLAARNDKEYYQDQRSELRKQLAEAQSSEAQWKANHDNVVRKLRLFTQREDLPVDRLPAYEYVLKLEKQLAEAQALLKRLSPLMINAGYVGANAEIQRALQDVRIDLCRLDTPALDAAIAEAVEPYRKEAACWQFARKELCWREEDKNLIRWTMILHMPKPNIGIEVLREGSIAKELEDAVLAAIAAKGEKI